jgi:hypothetical protein
MIVWINTGYGGGGVPNLVSWYYHFATELVMGPTSVLAAIRTAEGEAEAEAEDEGKGGSSIYNKVGIQKGDKLADHLIIPGVDWKDRYGLNEYLVQGTFMREAELVDRPTWARMTNGEKDWVLFDRGMFCFSFYFSLQFQMLQAFTYIPGTIIYLISISHFY